MGRTIDSELNKDSNILNGSATVFPITFDVTYDVDGNAEHIACKRTFVDENGNINEVDLVAGTDFTTSGKNVVYADAVNYSGDKLVKYRNVPKTQTQNFDNNGDNTPEDIGKALNKLTLMVQQLSEEQGRNVKLSIAESGDMTLPAQAVRASKMLGFDASGNPMAAEGIATAVSTFIATLVDDLSASAALTTLGITDFIKTLLDDATAAAARTTLDVYSKSETDKLGKPPIGRPDFCFSNIPDWAIPFDDGSGPYLWADYPEFDNDDFKAMLTVWSTAGWMSAYDETQFYVPDLRGMAFQIAGTNSIRMRSNSTGYPGGSLGAFIQDYMQAITGYITGMRGSSDGYSTTSGVFSGSLGAGQLGSGQGNSNYLNTNIVQFNSAYSSNARTSVYTKGATATIRLIVRFE